MTRRAERISSLIKDVLGQLILSKLSDPRIDPARTSVTRVEVPEDLLTARVYISVIGDEAETRLTVRALRHASGRLQELMMREISLRNTPVLDFIEDKQFKKTLQTYQLIQQAMDEIRRKEQAKGPAGEAGGDDSGKPEGQEDVK